MNRRQHFALATLAGIGLLAFSLALPRAKAQSAAAQSPTVQLQGSAPSSAPAATDASKLPVPIDEIIRRFAQHESEFKLARDNYTYTQDVLVEDVAPNQGEYRLTSDIIFTPSGKRYEQVTYAPQSTLQDFYLSPEDMKDLENIQPFVLTTEDLPKYNVEYVDTEKADELTTYVLRVAPKTIEKNQRYFQGTVWVDDHDFAVVKTDGKAVPEVKDQRFPRFVTYRENIEGAFWFPTYTHADDVLHFKDNDVHMRMTVRYKNYKRFGSSIRLGQAKTLEGVPTAPQPQPQPQPQPPQK